MSSFPQYAMYPCSGSDGTQNESARINCTKLDLTSTAGLGMKDTVEAPPLGACAGYYGCNAAAANRCDSWAGEGLYLLSLGERLVVK
jgi:hypothetical protein